MPRWNARVLELGAATTGFLAVGLLVFAPAFLAAFPAYGDIEGAEAANAHIRATASSLEHSPMAFLGYPFAAFPPNMAFYPPVRLLDLLVRPEYTFPILGVFHIICAGLGLYAVSRIALRTRPWPAFLAGAWFATSGFFVSHREHTHMLGAAAWMLLALAGTAWALRRRRPSGFLVTAAAVGMAFLAGHFQLALYGLVLVGISSLFFSSRPVSAAASTVGAAVLGMGLAAVLLVPAWDLLRQSTRMSIMQAELDAWSFSPFDFIGFIVPGAFGGYNGLIFTRYYGGVWTFVETACYVGLIPLALSTAFLITRCRRGWRTRWLLTLLAIGLILALGRYTPVYDAIRHIPGLNAFRAPGRWLFLVDTALALGAGLAIDRWFLRKGSSKAIPTILRTVSVLTTTVVLLLMALWCVGRGRGWTYDNAGDPPRPWSTVTRNLGYASHPFTPRLWIPLGVAALSWALARRGPRVIGGLALADTLLFALAVASRYPSDHPASRVPGQTILEDARLRGWEPATVRVLTDDNANAYAFHGLATVSALCAFIPGNLADDVPMSVFGTLRGWPPAEKIARMGISYVVSNGTYLPPIPASTLLEPVVPGRIYAVPSAQPLVRPSQSLRWEPGHISAEMPPKTPSREVEIACRWETGWRARADGDDIPLQPHGVIMIAQVPAGTRLLELVYENPAYATGRLISAAAVAVFALLAAVMAERRFLRRA